jgi:phosphatidate cytidylyltransferase
MVTRSLTGILLVITITISIMASRYSFMLLLLIIDVIALNEFYRLASRISLSHPKAKEGLGLSIVLFVSTSLVLSNHFDWRILLLNVPVVGAVFIYKLYGQLKNPLENLSLTFFGVGYITFPIVLFESIAFMPLDKNSYHAEIVLGYFVILWASDSGAYAVGSFAGKHKLFERISPKKTWEGSIGGGLLAVGAACIVSSIVKEIGLLDWIIITIIIVVMGTFGDLFKSLLKRTANVKDSGSILPGHGGFLDRFDSLIGSAPFVFSYIVCIIDFKS